MPQPLIFDGNGNPIQIIAACVLCPAEHIDAARRIAIAHINIAENAIDDRIGQMIPTALTDGTDGRSPTHYACFREVHDGIPALVQKSLDDARNKGNDWIADRTLTLADSPDFMRSRFCQVIGDKNAILKHASLLEI